MWSRINKEKVNERLKVTFDVCKTVFFGNRRRLVGDYLIICPTLSFGKFPDLL